MAIDIATKTKRALISLLNSLYNLELLPTDDFFFNFSTEKLVPYCFTDLKYGVLQKREPIEVVHRYACKRYMD